MRKPWTRQAPSKTLLVFLTLFFAAVAVSAEPAAPPASPTADLARAPEVAAPAPAETAIPAADCNAAATETSFSDLVAAPNDWQIQDASSCQYTCPQNLVMLCPSFPGYTTSCSSGCCTYTWACTYQSCYAGEACPDIGANNGRCVDGCCVY